MDVLKTKGDQEEGRPNDPLHAQRERAGRERRGGLAAGALDGGSSKIDPRRGIQPLRDSLWTHANGLAIRRHPEAPDDI
jgi:hypothetical protein